MNLAFVLIVLALVTGAASGTAAALRKQMPAWAIPFLTAGVLAIGAWGFFGPQAKAVGAGTPPPLPSIPPFKREYEQQALWYGEVLDGCSTWWGFIGCPTTKAILVFNPSLPAYWQMGPANAGLELMKRRVIPEEINPALPPVLATYLAEQAKAGLDLIKYFGYQRTSPIKEGDGRYLVYFDKTVVSFPGTSLDSPSDPSAVQRENVGYQLWSCEGSCTDSQNPDPWTSERKLLLSLAAATTLVGTLAMWRFGRVGGYAGDY